MGQPLAGGESALMCETSGHSGVHCCIMYGSGGSSQRLAPSAPSAFDLIGMSDELHASATTAMRLRELGAPVLAAAPAATTPPHILVGLDDGAEGSTRSSTFPGASPRLDEPASRSDSAAARESARALAARPTVGAALAA